MIKELKIWNNHLLSLEENISYIFLFMVILLVFVAAMLRTFGMPQSWMNDLAKLLFGWVVFLGSDIALSQNKHMGIEFIEEKLPPRIRLCIAILWSVLMIAFLLFAIRYGLILVEKNRREFDSLLISQLNIVRSIIGFGYLYIISQHFWRNWRKVAVITVITIMLIIIAPLFLSKEAQPLSYTYLMMAVPTGCALMVRTEIINIFKRWKVK